MHKRFSRNDVIFIIVIFAIVISAFIYFNVIRKDSGNFVKVTVDGKVFGMYSLDRDKSIDITDSQGRVINTLLIEDNCADMVFAECPDKLCVKQKSISYAGESIICLPNKVIVSVEGDVESDIDSISK